MTSADLGATIRFQVLATNADGKKIATTTDATHKVAQGEVGSTIRIKVTAKNSRGKSSAISKETAVVTDASGGGGGGVIELPGGGKSVDVVDVPKGERLIVYDVKFSPSPVRSRSQPIVVAITVKDTRGYYVRNAYAPGSSRYPPPGSPA